MPPGISAPDPPRDLPRSATPPIRGPPKTPSDGCSPSPANRERAASACKRHWRSRDFCHSTGHLFRRTRRPCARARRLFADARNAGDRRGATETCGRCCWTGIVNSPAVLLIRRLWYVRQGMPVRTYRFGSKVRPQGLILVYGRITVRTEAVRTVGGSDENGSVCARERR